MPDVFVAPSRQNPRKAQPTPPITHAPPVLSASAHTTLFAAFCQDPTDVSFQTQEPNEQVLLFIRRHFVTNVPWIVFTIALASIPLIFLFGMPQSASPLSFLPQEFSLVGIVFFYAALFGYAFVNFMTWYYNIGIVTNQRVVDIDFSDIVYHDVAQTKLNLIDDVNYTQSGFIRTFFNYGDVFIQTAGGKENLEFLAVPTPARATHILANLIGKGGQNA